MTNFPSLPANGEVLTLKIIEMVGSSTLMRGSGRGSAAESSVSPMLMPSMPASATISPAEASSIGVCFKPSNDKAA